jgi:hypothetical protein
MLRLFLFLVSLTALIAATIAGCGGSSDGEEGTAALQPDAEVAIRSADAEADLPGDPPIDPAAASDNPAAMTTDGAAIATLAVGQAGDTEPPTITPPPNVKTGASNRTPELGEPQVEDNADPNPTVTNDGPAKFPRGVTEVTWTATDAAGNTATAVQLVELDTRVPPPGGRPH